MERRTPYKSRCLRSLDFPDFPWRRVRLFPIGLLVLIFRFVFWLGLWLTPMGIIRLAVSWQQRCSYKLKNPIVVEFYTIIWLIVEACIFRHLLLSPNTNYWLLVPVWRLYDIVVSWIYLSFLRDEDPHHPGRSLILTFFHYLEIAMVFTIVNFILQGYFQPAFGNDIWNSFHYSVSVLVPIIALDLKYTPVCCFGYAILYTEIAISLLLHVVIIARVLSYFRQNPRIKQ